MNARSGRCGGRWTLAVLVAAGIWAASPAAGVAEAEPEGEESVASAAQGEGASPEDAVASEGAVPRGVFTRAIADREPTDQVEVLETDTDRIYYFTELQGLEGQAVTHRWEHAGELKAEVEFIVGGSRWRVYSSKNLAPSWVGDWTVSVVDEQGNVLRQDRFVYRAENVPAASAPATD